MVCRWASALPANRPAAIAWVFGVHQPQGPARTVVQRAARAAPTRSRTRGSLYYVAIGLLAAAAWQTLSAAAGNGLGIGYV